jgi:hypothetical protein
MKEGMPMKTKMAKMQEMKQKMAEKMEMKVAESVGPGPEKSSEAKELEKARISIRFWSREQGLSKHYQVAGKRLGMLREPAMWMSSHFGTKNPLKSFFFYVF